MEILIFSSNKSKIEEVLQSIKSKAKISKKGKKYYYNFACGFDTETSSFYQNLKTGKTSLSLDNVNKNEIKDYVKRGIVYEWTFGIYSNGDILIVIGRTLEEYQELYNMITNIFDTNAINLLIYVHNLAFDFQYIRGYFTFDKVFAIEERKVLKAITNDGVEYRCSYQLSGYSLSVVAKNLTKHKIEKLVGDLDYSKIRHSTTPLTQEELDYCIHDVLIILYYIDETITNDGDITKIPLTKTGYVRNYCRKACYKVVGDKKASKDKTRKYYALMQKLTLTTDEYDLLKTSFMGGFTHANAMNCGKVYENVRSFDETSAYPTVMIAEKFPMSKGIQINHITRQEFEEKVRNYCCVFDVELNDVESLIYYENYISSSKCRSLENQLENNGRIVSAKRLIISITNIDWEIIKRTYTFSSFRIGRFYYYQKGYLPTDFVKSILKLYSDKTTLKDVEGKEVEYLASKGMINSAYGCCVTDIVRDEIIYDMEGWHKEKNTTENIDKIIAKYNKSRNRFLFYAWGVFVTAYARANLWSGIFELKEDYIYSDTDSLKFINYDKHKQFFELYNNRLLYKLQKALDYHKIPYEAYKPKTIKGVEKILGVWDDEGIYDKFKTLGAKRYMFLKNDKLTLTISGVNKKTATPWLLKHFANNDIKQVDKVFNAFENELEFPKDATGKQTHTYLDFEYEGYVKDYTGKLGYYHEFASIHLESTTYSLSISQQFLDYLKGIKYIKI
jgi:hypothetical protein